MSARCCINQLPSDPQTSARLAHASFQDIADTKLATDLFDVHRLPFVDKARVTRDHEKGLETRERGNDVLDHSVSEVLLLWIAAHVLKRQDCNGRFVR